MSTTDWTVNQLGDEWNVVEWNDHFDPEVECARDGGQFAGWELTGAAGLSEDESHGQAPHP
jgi:hypothetical protein